MKKISGLLSKIILVIVGLTVVGINLAMGYIMFAPDQWWKPFYLNYYYHDREPSEPEETGTARQEPPKPTQVSESQPRSEPEKGSGEAVPTPPAPVTLEIAPGQGIMIDTGSRIVNLAEPTGRKVMRVNIVLEFVPTSLEFYTMAEEEKAAYIEEFKAEINNKMPVISNTLITLLSSQTFESVYTAEGKEALRQLIMDTINANLHDHRVIYVYFTEFVVQ
jgi:flagellar basal body-associated protein FliL